MKVVGLFIKRQKGHAVEAVEALTLRRGWGIAGDANAQVGSPRQILLASSDTLRQFGLLPGGLQENILLDGAVEEFHSGQVVQVGEQTLIRMMGLCEPCAVLEKLQPGLAKRIKGRRGMLGMVVRDGVVQVGDAIALTSIQFSSVPEQTRGKFEEFVARIPVGRVVRTSDVILALGLTPSHYRTIPILMKKAKLALPVHRIVGRDGQLMVQHLPDQLAILQSEGVEVTQNQVPSTYCWEAEQFHSLEPSSES